MDDELNQHCRRAIDQACEAIKDISRAFTAGRSAGPLVNDLDNALAKIENARYALGKAKQLIGYIGIEKRADAD